MAEVHAGLGDDDDALTWLAEAHREHAPELCWIGARPTFDRLRGLPAFAGLVRAIGLPAA